MGKFSSSLAGNAYTACGEAASALHAMALLQVYQAKAHKELQEGSSDTGVMQELRTVTDLALWATKVISHSLGWAMSTLVVQERHLWLNLADMLEPDKVWFLNAPVCQAGLFGDGVENFAQQISVAQKQTEAIKHILPRRPAAASTQSLAAVPPSMRAPACLHLVGRRLAAKGTPSPSRPLPNQASSVRVSVRVSGRPRGVRIYSLGNGVCITPCPRGGPGGGSFVSFCFCSAAGSSDVPIFSIKEQFPISLGWRFVMCCKHLCHLLPPLSLPAVSGVWFEDATRPSLTHYAPPWNQVSVAQLTQTPLRAASVPPELSPCVPPRCPSPRYVCGSIGPACMVSGSLACTPQPISLAHPHHQTRLCDSVRPASPKRKGHSLHLCAKQRCPCLTERDRGPPGKGRD